MKPMKAASGLSHRKMMVYSLVLYALVLLAEAASKLMAVLGEYAGDKLPSSLSTKVAEGVHVLLLSVVTYILALVLIYGLFAVLNGHYAQLLRSWIEKRRPRSARWAAVVSFLAVNGVFLTGVYGLNAALYPASSLAFAKGALSQAGEVSAVKTAASIILTAYLLGFIVLNVRYARKPVMAASLAVWAILLVAPLDPAFLLHGILSSRGSTRNQGPNVIMIGLDSLNPLHTGYRGYPLPLTPNLDAFLRENTVFGNCYTPIARTFPSWYSILTGQYPVKNGVRLNLQKRTHIKSAPLCIGHVLREKGYTTVHFTDEVRFSNITAAEGFDILKHPVMGIKDFLFGTFHDFGLTNVFFNNPLGYGLFPFLRFNRAVFHLYDGRYFINDLVTTLHGLRARERFFLAVHLCIGHWPYFHASPRVFPYRPGAEPSLALYDSALSIADEQLGRILRSLKASGLYENSIIIVLSDHGESADGHGSDLRDSQQNRVLLAWKPAGPAVHRDIGRLVRTIDIAPTVFDLLGAGTGGRDFDGVSLRPWIEGTSGPASEDSVFMETEFSLDTPGGVGIALQSMIEQGAKFYEFDRTGLITVRDDYYDVLIRRRNRAILTPDWKLIRNVVIRGGAENVRTALYDVRKDPGCEKDVATAEPGAFQDLWNRLSRYYGPELAPHDAEGAGR